MSLILFLTSDVTSLWIRRTAVGSAPPRFQTPIVLLLLLLVRWSIVTVLVDLIS